MRAISKSQIRRFIIQEYYRTSLVEQLYEQAAPTPTDPAAAPPADPAAAPPADPAAAPADPAAAAAPTPADPAATAPAAPPAPGAVPAAPVDPALAAAPTVPGAPAAPAAPVDPALAAAPTVPGAPAAPAVPGAPAAPAVPGAPAAPGAPTTSASKPKPPSAESTAGKVADAAADAIKSAEQNLATESLRRRSLKFLIEQSAPEPKIDMDVYASKLANLIKNYTSLVDVKKNVIDQAEKFLNDQFPSNSETLKKQLKDLLRKNHHISLERPEPPPDSYAIGAKGGGGGAA